MRSALGAARSVRTSSTRSGPATTTSCDAGYHRGLPTELWVPTAAVVVEVVSPDDETYAKFDFYARHHVDELLVADPEAGTIRCWHLTGTAYEEATESRLLGIAMAELVALIDWP